jgi:hypothetical protein
MTHKQIYRLRDVVNKGVSLCERIAADRHRLKNLRKAIRDKNQEIIYWHISNHRGWYHQMVTKYQLVKFFKNRIEKDEAEIKKMKFPIR